VSCVVGLAGVAVCSIVQGKIQKSTSYDRANRQIMKLLLEDIFIYLASASVILYWKGVGMAIASLAKQFPIIYADEDFTGVIAQLGSFLLLCICYASSNLIDMGAVLDGSKTDGAGVEFSRRYFAHFYSDYIAEREREEERKQE